MKTVIQSNLSLAAYHYKRAACFAAHGDTDKVERHLINARGYDSYAIQKGRAIDARRESMA